MIRALTLLVVLLAAGLASAQTRARDVVPADRARRTETLLARAFPGAAYDWDRAELAYRDGRRVPFAFAFFREHTQDIEMLVVASRAPDAREAEAVEQAHAFRAPAVALPRCALYLMRLDAGGVVLGYKEAAVDVLDAASTCDRVNFDFPYQSAGVARPLGSPPPWPFVLITVTTMHALPDAWASIGWAAVLDTDTLGWVSRLPVSFSAKRRSGESASFLIDNDRGAGSPGTWLFSGVNDNRAQPRWQVRAPCGTGRCMVDPRAVLDAAMQAAWRQ